MSDDKNPPSTADHVGQAAGGITGVLAGLAIGSTAGPIGTLLGGVAGAIGGWWSGRAIAEAAEDITEADDRFYHQDFARRTRPPDEGTARGAYDDARAAYLLGDLAAANPDYASFEDVEQDVARGWREAHTPCEWQAVRDCASVGFQRGRERRSAPRGDDRRRR